jgi:non-heme Fe2+,alpha-ketoglutarate-dependent halogenase
MTKHDAPADLAVDWRTPFLRDGFVGPHLLDVSDATLKGIASRLDTMLLEHTPHPLYGRFSVRDWHLVDEDLLRLFCHPTIIDAVSAILGPDLLLWRTKVFVKRPGEAALGWHQEWGAFNGEEIGNDRPALAPASIKHDEPWNVTVWIALDDVTPDMGPIRFARGTHRTRFPIEMQPLMHSEFWHDPFLDIGSTAELVRRANENSLVLDIDTHEIFRDPSSIDLPLAQAKEMLLQALQSKVGAVTCDFYPSQHVVHDMPMKAGSFVMFSERTMHGSPANTSTRRRLAVNARFTKADTVVYPFRERGEWIDGSNLDVSRHACVLVSGNDLTRRNVLRPVPHG